MKLYLHIVFCYFALSLSAQDTTAGWVRHYFGKQGSMYSVYPRTNGYMFFAVNQDSVWAGKTDTVGALQETISYGYLGGKDDIIPVEQESVLKAGISDVHHAVLEKRDAHGILRWSKVFEDTLDLTQVRLTKLADNSYLVVLMSAIKSNQPFLSVRLVKLDSLGKVLWDQKQKLNYPYFGMVNQDYFNQQVYAVSNGGFVLSDEYWNSNFRLAIIGYFDSNGNLLWRTYPTVNSGGYYVSYSIKSVMESTDSTLSVLVEKYQVDEGPHSSSATFSAIYTYHKQHGAKLAYVEFPKREHIGPFNTHTYAPLGKNAVGFRNGKMVMLVGGDGNRLIHVGTNLRDTTWERYLTAMPSLRSLRNLYPLSDCGSVLIGGDLFLLKTDCDGKMRPCKPIPVTDIYQIGEYPGEQMITYMTEQGCDSTVVLHWITDAPETGAPGSLSIRPNPVTERLIIQLDDPMATKGFRVVLHDALGRQIVADNADSHIADMDLSALPSGMYVAVIVAGKRQWVRKVIKAGQK